MLRCVLDDNPATRIGLQDAGLFGVFVFEVVYHIFRNDSHVHVMYMRRLGDTRLMLPRVPG